MWTAGGAENYPDFTQLFVRIRCLAFLFSGPGLQSPDPLTPTTVMRAEDILNPAHPEAMCEDDLSSSRERMETASINQSCHEGARPNVSEYASARPTERNSTASSSSLQSLSAKHQVNSTFFCGIWVNALIINNSIIRKH